MKVEKQITYSLLTLLAYFAVSALTELHASDSQNTPFVMQFLSDLPVDTIYRDSIASKLMIAEAVNRSPKPSSANSP